ncbi:hypothetical protein J2T12_005087 [Paenibacillus anaericanus]|uniref:hypothetical protein n=1 Tax=Paenibacillus anaericanus TaxID=170367 RepID=UPI002780FDA4|nr:hypothetical protein [Paenibacillus anaericanus]MDQ0091647.1 hypothetical protein [Paenibacillus anaericanus]
MSRDTRDWQKDKAICTQSKVNGFSDGLSFLPILPDIGLYWLQQYANMKDSKQTYRKVAQKYSRKYRAEKERADKAEEREQKLKEALEEALKWTWYHGEANMKEIEEGLQETMETMYHLDKEEDI